MMGKRIGAVVGLLALIFGVGGWMQKQASLPPAKIAVVNFMAVVKGLPEFKAAQATLDKEVEAAQKASDKAVADFQAKAAQFEQQMKVMSAANREAKAKLLQAEQDSLQRDQQMTLNRLKEKEAALFAPIREKVMKVIDAYRAEAGLQVVFDIGSDYTNIVAFDNSLDVTFIITSRLNSTATKTKK